MRKLNLILITVALCIAPLLSLAQYFQRLHDYDTTGDFGWNIFVQTDGSYFATTGAQSNNTFKDQQGWMDISQDGNILSNKKLLSSPFVHYYEGFLPGIAVELQDGGHLVPISFFTGNRSSMGLMRLDAQHDTVFTRFFTDTSQRCEDVGACAVLTNGDFIIGGYSGPNSMPVDSAIIIRTDSLGVLKWKRRYKKVQGDRPYIVSLQALDNNRILVGGMSQHLVVVGTDYYGHNRPWFMILDSAGNILKDTVYMNGYAGAGRIYKDMYGGYFHYGVYDSLYTSDISDYINNPEYIAHLNDNFEIEWIRNLGTWDGHKSIWHGEQLQDGTFQLCGTNHDDDTWNVGWAARFDHNGWAIWDQNYVCDSAWSSYLVDFDERPDGSLIMIGAARNDTLPQWRGQEMWLISVDANGCLVQGCDPNSVREAVKFDNPILFYPNPNTGSFTIEAPENGTAHIFDITGKSIGRYPLPKGKKEIVLAADIVAGIYLLQFKGAESGAVSTKRLVKE